MENEAAKPQPRERKSSLAAVQKTLDSILEESEHDSSTKRSTIESDSNNSDQEETESEITSDENEEEEDFDSDCSEMSVEQLDTEAILCQFAADTDELIKKEQESILNEFLQSNSDLSQLTQNLERLNSEIVNIGNNEYAQLLLL